MMSYRKHVPESVFMTFVVFIVAIGLLPLPCNAQADTVKRLKNTIRVNVTNPMIFGTNYNVIGYERVIKDHQTASINIGRFALPKFKSFDFDSVGLTNDYHDKGFNISFDYRFYLKNENKYLAPRGVYIGPYYAFNYFNRELNWDLNTSNLTGKVKSNIDLMANFIGIQLGYQFVLWNRLSIDMILLGPSVWFFKLKTDFDSSLSDEDEVMLLEKINELLEEKFPGKDLVIKGGGFEARKTTSTYTMGFRYMINLGFRF